MARHKNQSKAWAEKQKKRRDAKSLKKKQNEELLSLLKESRKQVDADKSLITLVAAVQKTTLPRVVQNAAASKKANANGSTFESVLDFN
jgi:hypothetical protein